VICRADARIERRITGDVVLDKRVEVKQALYAELQRRLERDCGVPGRI
jgi:hypothetical protein